MCLCEYIYIYIFMDITCIDAKRDFKQKTPEKRLAYLSTDLVLNLSSYSLDQFLQMQPMWFFSVQSPISLFQIESFLLRAASVLREKLMQLFSLSSISIHSLDETTKAQLQRWRTSPFLKIWPHHNLAYWAPDVVFKNIHKLETDKD